MMKVSRPIFGLFQGEVCLCYYLYTPLWPALFTLLLNLIESGKEEKREKERKLQRAGSRGEAMKTRPGSVGGL